MSVLAIHASHAPRSDLHSYCPMSRRTSFHLTPVLMAVLTNGFIPYGGDYYACLGVPVGVPEK